MFSMSLTLELARACRERRVALRGRRLQFDFKKVLNARGTFVSCSGGNSSFRWLVGLAQMSFMSSPTGRKFKGFIVSPNRPDLLSLKDLVEAGKAKPAIERVFALEQRPEALSHVGAGHVRGQVVVRVAV